MKNQTLAVFGLGYVGCVTAACLADFGHQVIGVDIDPRKIQSIQSGRAPFFEPQLDDIVARNVRAGRLRATSHASEALGPAAIALLCVGTPSERNGNINLSQLKRVTEEIAEFLQQQQPEKPLIVVVRSTVFPGTCENLLVPLLRPFPNVRIVCNPEFLREGNAVHDFLNPGLIVIGGDDKRAVETVASLYASLPVQPALVSLRTAEMIKYACNAFHALKIAFANEIGALCTRLGISGQEVMETLTRDHVLNISAAYLKPGFAFGGSCLPKDLRALTYQAIRSDLRLPLLESILVSNEEHLRRAIEATLELTAEKLGIFGLAFKENTDDLRESPAVRLIEHLIGKGKQLRVYDPNIRLENIYGSNQRYLLSTIPHISRLLTDSFQELLDWAEALVLTQKLPLDLREKLARKQILVLDLSAAELKPALAELAEPAASG